MRLRRFQNKLTRGLSRGLLCAAALSFIVGAVGVPLPIGRVKDRSVPFPCMDRSCGCHDAADCKKHCCCFSSEEKLAWSTEHGVDPTPFVDDEALAALPPKCGDCDRQSCHGHGPSPASDLLAAVGPAGEQNHAATSCCAKKEADQTRLAADRSGGKRAGDPTRGSLTIGAYQQCTGLASFWTLVHAALPPAKRVRCEFQWLVVGWVTPQDCPLTSIRFSPPTPPPRA
ncbi:MAG TPA: hypothetical protein VG826_31940 [Pirellulales bacterium]|nr:hypothetical protein [Pirellulales bacterium]